MARSDFIRNELASEYAGRALYASLHVGTGAGATGANELAVARQPIIWISSGVGKIQSAPMSFDVPAGTVLKDVGMWTEATGGTYVDSVPHDAEFPTERAFKIVLTYQQP